MAVAQIGDTAAEDLANSCPFARQSSFQPAPVARQFTRDGLSILGLCDQSWSAVEDTFKLSCWDSSRRAVGCRWAAKTNLALSQKIKDEKIELRMPDKDVQAWECTVL